MNINSFNDNLINVNQNVKNNINTLNTKKTERLNDFCKLCPGMTNESMMNLIEKGKKIESQLILIKNSPFYKNKTPKEKAEYLRNYLDMNATGGLTLAKPENAVALIWCLIDKAADQDGPILTNGSMRHEEGEIIRDFLKECGRGDPANNKPHLGYYRISSHFKELLGITKKFKADDPQMGLDLRNMNLPAGKHTVLFGLLPDGSVFIKLEERGCPPMVSWDNLKENIMHGYRYIRSRKSVAALVSLFSKDEGKKIKRKEHVPTEVKKEFQKTMQVLFPAHKLSFFNRLLHKGINHQGYQLYKEGKKFGISRMNEIMVDLQNTGQLFIRGNVISMRDSKISKINESEVDKPRFISEKIKTVFEPKHAIPQGYTGDVKGDEVLLTWNEQKIA
ncbi:MAG: hypothetical protein Q8K60_01620 [Parachlamydiaceae bacterium]|nr:hypothetical protein [Parachlamydiaceae bacterium]